MSDTCEDCGGSGMLDCEYCGTREATECDACDGTGEIESDNETIATATDQGE